MDFEVNTMSRILKQILYGVGYILFFSLLVWVVGGSFQKTKPTCFDRAQNQNETGVDCGGLCRQACALREAPLEARGEVEIFHENFQRVVLLQTIANPNDSYNASQFFYRFLIYGKTGEIIERIDMRDSIYASEEKLVFGGRVEPTYDEIERVEFQIGDVTWESSASSPRAKLTLSGQAQTSVQGNTIRVIGTIGNQSPFTARAVKIIAILINSFGDELFASQTVFEEIQGFSEAPFTVSFPESKFLRDRVDPAKTKIVVSG